MTTPPEPGKDDRISLLKSLHRPYGQLDDGDDRYPHPQQIPEKQRVCRSYKGLTTILLVLAAILVVVVVACLATLGDMPAVPQAGELSEEPPDVELDEGVTVKTNCGRLVGAAEEGAYIFKGIAYAKPPVGRLRWRKPVPLWIDHAWCESHRKQDARKFRPPCFQVNPYTKEYEGQEDCLFLDVWTPKVDSSAGLEVMVWIHGGFLQFDSSHHPKLRPTGYLSSRLNVVFVSVNYRIYTLGFMALDLLVDNILTDSLGNYGIWDQVVALQWVKDNIRNFGGDPNKVTLFGPDAGGSSILALMTSSSVQGLFRSVWLIGPTSVFNRTFNEMSLHNHAFFLRRTGCTDARCLRKKTAREVVEAHLGKDDPSFRIRDQNDLPIQGIFPEQLIVTDGDLVPAPPLVTIQSTERNGFPVLLGTAAQAVDFWPGPDDLRSWSWPQYKKYVTTSLDSFGPRVSQMALSLYNNTYSSSEHLSPEFLYTTMVSDVRQTCPNNVLALEMSKSYKQPIYRYIVTSCPSQPIRSYDYDAPYSSHMWEVVAFFDQLETFIKEPTSEDFAFRDIVHHMVMSFVRSGGAEVGFPEWLRFSKKTALLSHNVTVTDANKTECKFWSQNGLGIYAWVS